MKCKNQQKIQNKVKLILKAFVKDKINFYNKKIN